MLCESFFLDSSEDMSLIKDIRSDLKENYDLGNANLICNAIYIEFIKIKIHFLSLNK